jgi:hypothetical protein
MQDFEKLNNTVVCHSDRLRFETSLFIASYDSQGHGGGIRLRLHTSSTELQSRAEQ